MTMSTRITPERVQPFLDGIVAVDREASAASDVQGVVEILRACGVGAGTAVLVVMPNGRAFAETVFAVLLRGAVPVLLSSAAPASRIRRIAEVIGASVVIVPAIPVALQDGMPPQALSEHAQIAFLNIPQRRDYEAGQIILLTSGTSGIFSGCLFDVDALLRNACRHAAAIGQGSGDTVLINLPTYYSYAFVAQILATYAVGGRAVISGPPFTPANYGRVLAEYGVTVSSLTPVMVEAWRNSGAQHLPASLRCLTIGGASLAARSVGDILRRNPSLEVYLTYGLTECGPRVATLAAHREPAARHASVGLPLPGVAVELRRDHPAHDVGELIVETDTGMIRRIGRSDADPIPVADGRVRIATRDIFRMDADGYLYFQERRSSSALIRGEKVDLRSVCKLAESIDGVAKAEAWIQNDHDGGDSFMLDVYCRASLTSGDIRRQLGRVLLRSEQPTHLALHPETHIGWRKTEDAGPSQSSERRPSHGVV